MTPSADDFDHDVVVVGSGFGGSVSALRLAEKGWKVALLEQGRRLSPEDLERAGTDARALAWMPGNPGAVAALSLAQDELRAKSRDLVRRNAWAAAGVEAFVANAIGTGIKPQSMLADQPLREAIHSLWWDWCEEADAAGLTDFYGLQALACRAMLEGGECLVRLRYRLAMLAEPPSPEEQQGLERDLGALDALIEEMLTYARLDRPELPLQCSDLELGSWAGSRLADWQALRPDKRLDFVRPAMALPWRGDTRLLDRALENLIGNALRHAASRVSLAMSRQQDHYLLEVADDGPGIDPALAPQIFEPFVRLDQSRDRRTGGAGLGLAIVRSIARHHGGEVQLLPSSSGARFCLTLPVHLDTNRHQSLTEPQVEQP